MRAVTGLVVAASERPIRIAFFIIVGSRNLAHGNLNESLLTRMRAIVDVRWGFRKLARPNRNRAMPHPPL
jgi:hypothetical protein